ncbi:Kinesin-like protein KIF3A [Tritrichomonas foetus]|uniref:Kinesin-like protein n=1 Tax=Tritrichomonas foetus TaxID=1144522 RepID=A0A1J4J7M6_9EUKA|nr:Kinesin-like protein KIF3A [Tritrichomonas foetus]|eukprot:OHS93659.1 Kinesin-like protein KIF3A [Tritrichomonas foetus]
MSQRECVKVAVRVRPMLQSTNEINTDDIIEVDQNNGSISIVKDAKTEQKNFYTFDYAFPPDCTQQEVYEMAANDIIHSVLEGYNGTIFAYGQTGSGKTYTMYGKGSGSTRGIIPRAVVQIFDFVKRNQEKMKIDIKASYVQLYNDQLLDLLNGSKDPPKILLREDSNHSFQMENNTIMPITCIDDLNSLLATGKKNRKVRRTQMNDESTRAHTILSIWIETVGSTTKMGRLNLVDLAGSEKSTKAGTEGEALKEGSSINYALLILGNCISALTSKKPMTVIPYRESPLTKLLKDSLGGNAKTLMIVTLSPSSFNAYETLNTLRYAQKAKMIRNNAVVNMDPKDALLQKYQRELAELQTRLAQQSAYIENCGADKDKGENEKDMKSFTDLSTVQFNTRNDIEIIQCETERIKKERIEMNKMMIEEEKRIQLEMEKQNEMIQRIHHLSKIAPPNKDLIRKKERLRKTKEKIGQKKALISKEYDDILETWQKLSMVVKKHIPRDELKMIYANAEYDEETMQWRMRQKRRSRTADSMRPEIEIPKKERPGTPQ